MEETNSKDDKGEFEVFLACEARNDHEYPIDASYFREPLYMLMVHDFDHEGLIPFNFENLERCFLGLARNFNGYLCFRSEEEAYAEIERLSEKANSRQLSVVEIDFGQATDEQSQYYGDLKPDTYANFAIATGNRHAVGFKAERSFYLNEAFNYYQSKHLFESYIERLFSGSTADLCIADEVIQAFDLLVVIRDGTIGPNWEFEAIEVHDSSGNLDNFYYLATTEDTTIDTNSVENYPVDFGTICAEYLERGCIFDLTIALGSKSYKLTKEICERVVEESLLLDQEDTVIISGYSPIHDTSDIGLNDEELESIRSIYDDCDWLKGIEFYSGTVGEQSFDFVELELYDVAESNIDELVRDFRRAVSNLVRSEIKVVGFGIPPLTVSRNTPSENDTCTEVLFAVRHRYDRDIGLVIDPLGLRAGYELSSDLRSNSPFN